MRLVSQILNLLSDVVLRFIDLFFREDVLKDRNVAEEIEHHHRNHGFEETDDVGWKDDAHDWKMKGELERIDHRSHENHRATENRVHQNVKGERDDRNLFGTQLSCVHFSHKIGVSLLPWNWRSQNRRILVQERIWKF